MTSNTADPVQPTPSTVVVATDGSVTVTQVSNATTVTWPGVFVPAATVPAQVGTVTPTAGNAEVGLSWSAPDDGGSAITDYSVQYSTDDATWSTFAHGTTATTATVTGLTNDTLYYFRVAAINAIGTGAYSASVTATPEAPFSPLDLSPTIWLDASDEATITESSGSVSQWDDKSGNNYDLTQGTAANQPTTGTRTMNSLNVVDFDGSSDRMVSAALSPTLTQPNTIFIVFVPDATSAQYLFDGISASNRNTLLFDTGYRIYAGVLPARTGTVSTVPQITRTVFDSTSSSLHIDGASVFAGDAGTISFGSMTLGARYDGTATLDGAVAEIIVVDGSLTAQQISDTETYLADKWGITL